MKNYIFSAVPRVVKDLNQKCKGWEDQILGMSFEKIFFITEEFFFTGIIGLLLFKKHLRHSWKRRELVKQGLVEVFKQLVLRNLFELSLLKATTLYIIGQGILPGQFISQA